MAEPGGVSERREMSKRTCGGAGSVETNNYVLDICYVRLTKSHLLSSR